MTTSWWMRLAPMSARSASRIELVLGAQRERLGDPGRRGEGAAVVAGLGRVAQALGELERAPRARVGQDDGELVAAHAVGERRPRGPWPGSLGQACRRSSPAWWPCASLTALRSSTSRSTSASGTPVRATTCSSRATSFWKARWLRSPVSGSVIAISARRSTSAARAASRRRPEPEQEAGEPGEETDREREGEGGGDEDVALQTAQFVARREPGRGGRLRGTRDAVLEDAVGRVDDLVLPVLHAGRVVRVDRREQPGGRVSVRALQAQEARDVAAARGAAVEAGGASQRRDEATAGGGVLLADAVGPGEAVLALDGLLLAGPVARALEGRGEPVRGLRALREAGRAPLRDEREAPEEDEHGEHRRGPRAHCPPFVDPFQSRHGPRARDRQARR